MALFHGVATIDPVIGPTCESSASHLSKLGLSCREFFSGKALNYEPTPYEKASEEQNTF